MNLERLRAETIMANEKLAEAVLAYSMWSLGSCLAIAGGLEKAKRAGRDQERMESGHYGMAMYSAPAPKNVKLDDIYWYRDELRRIEAKTKSNHYAYDWMGQDLRKKP